MEHIEAYTQHPDSHFNWVYPKYKVRMKLFLCLINSEPHHEAVFESGGTAPSLPTLALG
jgi:hypothetical protein